MATPIDAVILAWFKQEKSRLVEYNRLGFPPRAIRGKYGPFRFDGPRVTQRDGTQFATLLESDGKMFVLLELPNFFTVDLHRMMHRLMEGQGVTVLTMPSGVLSSAEVSVGSIEVIDQGRPRPLRFTWVATGTSA